MEWLRVHQYAAALVIASILVITGALIVAEHSSSSAPTGMSAWAGNAASWGTTAAGEPNTAPGVPRTQPMTGAQYDVSALPTGTQAPTATAADPSITGTDSSSYDFNALMAQLSSSTVKSVKSKPVHSGGSAGATTSIDNWSYIPTSILSLKNPSSSRTPAQQALYQYGNEVGSYIEGYDGAHTNQTQIISDAINDRHSTTKAAAVAQIGTDLEVVGQGIASVSDTPSDASAQNAALAKGYITIGEKLVAVATAMSQQDSELGAAIKSYDASVNAFNVSYVSLATLFSSAGVRFSNSDPGSVFSFNSSTL